MALDPRTSQALALIRWPLIMCIVAVHVFYPATVDIHGQLTDLSSSDLYMGWWHIVRGFIMENGVATFFFISGYLFFAGGEMTMARFRTKVHRRIHSLLIPYILWNAIAVLFLCMLALPLFNSLVPGFDLSEHFPTWKQYVKGFFMHSFAGYPHNPPLWFIRELMVCVAVVPVFNAIMKRTGIVLPVLLGILCCYLYTRPSDYFLLLVSALFFFYFGAWLGMRGHDLLRFFARWKVPCIILYPLLGILFIWLDGPYPRMAMFVKSINLMVVIGLAVNIAGYCVHRHNLRANRFLNGATFFVFAAHYIGLDYFRKAVFAAFHPTGELGYLATMFAVYFFLLAELLLVYWLLTRLAPPLARVLTGKRTQISPASPAPKSAKS